MLENSTGRKRDHSSAKFTAISRQVSPASPPDVSAGNCQRALVDESGIIRTQMNTHNRSVMVAVLGTLCAIPPRNNISIFLKVKCVLFEVRTKFVNIEPLRLTSASKY
jgi:hypothetical protein